MNTKILLIEDDMQLSNQIKLMLENEGYIVIQAGAAADGIIKYSLYNPDLIICDVTIPLQNGYEILENLKNTKMPFITPFIFLNEHTKNEDIRKSMDLGADDYITRPFDPAELLSSVKFRLIKNETLKFHMGNNNSSKRYGTDDRMFFHVNGSITPVIIQKIIYISAENQYSNVYVEGGKKIIQRRALRDWQDILPKNLFIRIHRATLVNKNYIKEIRKTDNNLYKVYLENSETELEVSRRLFKNLKNKI